MTEFQYCEFVAIDRLLSAMERKRLRETTSRATITSTRLVNTYEWGNFKADPRDLVAKCFDRLTTGTRRVPAYPSCLTVGRHADKGEHEVLLLSVVNEC